MHNIGDKSDLTPFKFSRDSCVYTDHGIEILFVVMACTVDRVNLLQIDRTVIKSNRA